MVQKRSRSVNSISEVVSLDMCSEVRDLELRELRPLLAAAYQLLGADPQPAWWMRMPRPRTSVSSGALSRIDAVLDLAVRR